MLKKILISFIVCILPVFVSYALSEKNSLKSNSRYFKIPQNHLQGPLLSNESLENKVVILDFWASWCGPCKEALPFYEALYLKYKDQGLEVIGVNAQDTPKERTDFLKSVKLSFPIFEDSTKNSLVNKLDLVALPTLFMYDRSGKVILSYRGFDQKKMAELEEKVKEALAQKM